MRRDSAHDQVTSAVNEGWVAGGSFFGSIASGTLLGYVADRLLGTDPWLVVAGIVLGSYAGFLRLWQYSRKMVEPRGR